MKRVVVTSLLMAALVLPAGAAMAADQDQDRLQTRDQIYGSQLMTPQERSAYRDRLRSAKTMQERQRIRNEHHQRMQERARERGMTLPAEPPARPGGMGPGSQGGGMGPGQGGGMMQNQGGGMMNGGGGGGGRGR